MNLDFKIRSVNEETETQELNLLRVVLLSQKKKKKIRKVPAEVTRERCPSTAPPSGTHTPLFL